MANPFSICFNCSSGTCAVDLFLLLHFFFALQVFSNEEKKVMFTAYLVKGKHPIFHILN